MKLYRLYREQVVPKPLEEVFAFFDRPENLNLLTPPELDFRILTPSPVPMHQGAMIDYSIRLWGIPVRWTSYIAVYEPPYRFVDVQLRGPYSFWYHLHKFQYLGGNTLIVDEVLHLPPFGLPGRLFYKLWIRPRLDYIFDYRRKRITEIFG